MDLPQKNILLAHGVTYSSHEFDINYKDYSLARRLAREGYAVWLLDIAGFGFSGKVEDGFLPDSDYAAEDIYAAAEKIISLTKQEKIDVLGWSWGTVTSSLFVAAHPNLVNRYVMYAPILCGIGEYEVEEPFHYNTWEHAADDFQRTEEGEFDYSVVDPAMIEMFCSSSWHYDGESSPNGGRRDLCVADTQLLIDLEKIEVPTLVICGDEDPYLKYDLVNASLDSLPEGSELEIIEGGSHVVFYEEPYYRDFQEHLTQYTVPETKYYLSEKGEMYEAMTEGQAFRGTIYGPDSAIRQIVDYISKFPVMQIGTLSEEGFGEVYAKITAVKEAEIPGEKLSRCFDVCCISDTLILNDRGMPTCRVEDLLSEIEHVLDVHGKLRVTGKYTAIQKDYTWNERCREDQSVVRCFAMGSILRLESMGEPMDISRITHCFIGERNGEGYGELTAWPARGEYYRLAKKVIPNHYEHPGQATYRDFIFGAQMTGEVINEMIKGRVSGMGIQDREELEAGISPEEMVPLELLHMIRELYNPVLEEKQLVQWYRDGLMGGADHEPD